MFQLLITAAREELRRCNEQSRSYGLILTDADITELVELRANALRNAGRVEFGGCIIPKLVDAFCDSPYMDAENYAANLGELQDAFYYFRSEVGEHFSDDELISFMVSVWNGKACGSTELLTTIFMDQVGRWTRNGFNGNVADEEVFD